MNYICIFCHQKFPKKHQLKSHYILIQCSDKYVEYKKKTSRYRKNNRNVF